MQDPINGIIMDMEKPDVAKEVGYQSHFGLYSTFLHYLLKFGALINYMQRGS
jgi:hypothetical protein